MLEDLHIRAIVHQLLYGLLHGFSKLGVALLDSDALLGHAFDVTQGLKLSVGLGDGITGDRRIGIERIGLARSHCSGRFGLTLVRPAGARGKQPPLPGKTEGEPKDDIAKQNEATFAGMTA